jgi:hypothetical protein
MKLEFKNWLFEIAAGTLETEIVDSKQIETIYNKSDNAVALVRRYGTQEGEHDWIKKRLGWKGPRNDFGYLLNISTVLSLTGDNIYGLFNSKENTRILDGQGITFRTNQEITRQQMQKQELLKNLAFNVIKQQFPDVDTNAIHDSSIIHVNVQDIINDKKQQGLTGINLEKAIIAEIASTIVHESTHQLERTWLGKTDENGPREAEAKFMNWLQRNPKLLDEAAAGRLL